MKSARHWVYNLLRQSESFFKTDMVYLAKGGFWLTLGQGVASISSFLLAIAFANFLPKEAYGTYKYIMAIAGTLSIFTLTGMGTAVTQAVAKGFDKVLMPAFRAKLQWGVFGSLAGFIGATYYYTQGNDVLAIGLIIISIFMPFMEAFSLYDSMLHGKKKFDTSTKFFMAGQTISATISIAVIFLTNNVLWLILVYFSSWTLIRYIFFKHILDETKTPEKKEPKIYDTISYGKHLSLMGVLSVIANYADRILVFHYVGAAEAAIYSIAIAIPEQIKGSFKNLGALALPKFSEDPRHKIEKSLWVKMLKLALVYFVITILYIIISPSLFELLFPRYLDSVVYSQIFSISLVAAISVVPTSLLLANQKSKELYILNTASPIVQLILLFVGIYFFGLLGIVIARVITRFVNFAILLSLLSGSLRHQSHT